MSFTEQNKPNLFIVGAPKAGTTFLYHTLKKHPDIFLSELKETNYFSIDAIEQQQLFVETENIHSLAEYEKAFEPVTTEKVIGEASVSYLFYPETAQKIHSFNPDATIVVLLRNPVERAYSHYLMDYNFGYVNDDFEKVIDTNYNHKYADLYYQQYIELGFYDEQIPRYVDLFGSQVKIYLTDQLKEGSKKVLADLFETLGIDEVDLLKKNRNSNSFKKARFPGIRYLYGNHNVKQTIKKITGSRFNAFFKRLLFEQDAQKPQMNEEIRQQLNELYAPHIKKTQQMIEQDITHWIHT